MNFLMLWVQPILAAKTAAAQGIVTPLGHHELLLLLL